MRKEKLKDIGIRVSFFMTRPGMIFVNLVVVFLLYVSLDTQGIGFFYIIGLIIACFVRNAKTPQGQFFHPVSYYSNADDNTPKAGFFRHNRKQPNFIQKPKQLNVDNHEKIHDRHELNQINRKFKEIEEGFDGFEEK